MSGKIKSTFIALAALVLFSFGAAQAATFSINVKPPGYLGTPTEIQGLGTTAFYYANTDGSFTITDQQTYTALVAQGWRKLDKTVHSGGSLAVVSAATQSFIPWDGMAAIQSANEGDVSAIVAAQGTLSSLKCVSLSVTGTPTAVGAGASQVIVLNQNQVATGVTCTISGATATSCTDTTHTVVANIGDQFDYLVTPDATPAPTATVIKCSMQLFL